MVDASFFVSSSGAVNPALTIMANALRVGDHLKQRLRVYTSFNRHRATRCTGWGAVMPAKIRLALLLSLTLILARPLFSAADPAPPVGPTRVRAIGPILITVADMDRSIDFYSRILTFEKVSDAELAEMKSNTFLACLARVSGSFE